MRRAKGTKERACVSRHARESATLSSYGKKMRPPRSGDAHERFAYQEKMDWSGMAWQRTARIQRR